MGEYDDGDEEGEERRRERVWKNILWTVVVAYTSLLVKENHPKPTRQRQRK
jgi:hypothetical protein